MAQDQMATALMVSDESEVQENPHHLPGGQRR
jgi:hypothetical protein